MIATRRSWVMKSSCSKWSKFTQSLWERACSRRGRHIQPLQRLIQRLREQARSHMNRIYLQDLLNLSVQA
ncbi:hypothetical protein EGJ55_11250 [Pseudomonas moraviensis]|nr:hypothetical protein EGJ55_11250 [Pseudomonas moraviensis]